MPMDDDSVGVITKRAYARIGLLGNPSDGYYGKTISVSIKNFFAEVHLTPNQQPFSSRVSFEPGPFDTNMFASLEALAENTSTHGYYGGVRLLRALCYKFHGYCAARGVPLHERGFNLAYHSNIPKQTGLSGSSSILVAGLRCLMQHYDVDIPLEEQPSLVLSCETDLGINAGLQDRVIQCYEGVVYMDFSDVKKIKKVGRGTYERLPESCVPRLHLVYAEKNPSDSGKTHSTVKARWESGDVFIREKMEEVAMLAEKGRATLLLGTPLSSGTCQRGDARTEAAVGEAVQGVRAEELAKLMNKNFDLRREMFGDDALGAFNVDMVTTPRSVGAAAKFTGSGGAAVVYCPGGVEQVEAMTKACEAKGLVVCQVEVNEHHNTTAA